MTINTWSHLTISSDYGVSHVAQVVNNLPAMLETGFDPWVGKIPWRRKWQPYFSILAWKIPWTEEPGKLQSRGWQRVGHNWPTNTITIVTMKRMLKSKHVYYLGWNRSPAQVGCMRQVLGAGALGIPRGIGWRRRWEGGSGWGIHVYPWLIHVNVWQKPLQYCKVISLQLIKNK